jgi:hypothetical protein
MGLESELMTAKGAAELWGITPRKGIGKYMTEQIISFLKADMKSGWGVSVDLMSTVGKEGFYEKLGFVSRPRDRRGAGMDMWITKEWVEGYSNGQVFIASIDELGDIPDYEMAEVRLFDTIPDKMRFPKILPALFERVRDLTRPHAR